MTLGRRRVDTQGVVPDCNNSHFMLKHIPGAMNDEWYIDAALLTLWPPALKTDSTRKGCEILRWAPTPVCLPSVYLMSLHVTKSSRPSSSVFACILQAIKHWEVRTAWERGYMYIRFRQL